MSSHCETIVQAISSFYNVLSTFGYLPPSSIATPPPSGWHADDDAEPPSPVRALLRREGKDEAVLDVLNHLPYLTNADLQVHHDTIALDWRPVHHLTTPSSGASATQLSVHHALALPQTLPQACLEPTGLQPAVPAHMVALTRATSNYGRWLLLDVEAGTVTNYSLLGEPQGEDEEEEGVAAGSGTGWRRHETARVADFFAAWGAKLTSLAWVPVPGDVESRTGEIRTPACVGDEVQEVRPWEVFTLLPPLSLLFPLLPALYSTLNQCLRVALLGVCCHLS